MGVSDFLAKNEYAVVMSDDEQEGGTNAEQKLKNIEF